MSAKPFKINVSEPALADLRERLARTRWPAAIAGAGWRYGVGLDALRELAEHWRTAYDWRKTEAALNALPQFTATIDGQNIHFIHVRSPEKNALPLILTHGWPSSVMEFMQVIAPLSDPRAHGGDAADAFDLIIPAIPGYGFSGPTAEQGWDSARVAKAWDALAKSLGYARYGAHGGDAGGLVTRELGILKPEGLVGVHLLQIFAFPSGAPGEMERMDDFEKGGMANLGDWELNSGYAAIQKSRPQTLAYGLADSPAAQLAWIADFLMAFDQGVDHLGRDYLLDQATLYWLTNTGGSAALQYFEDARSGAGYREERNETPTGVAVFPYDFRSVRAFAERSTNIVHWSQFDRGGHFAALDAPDLLVGDLRKFFRTFR